MRIGLVQFDGKIPHLALMKISSYHKSNGDSVEFAEPGREYDQVYVSILFSWNKERALQHCNINKIESRLPIVYGGTGYNIKMTLSPEMAAMRPDYDLYCVDRVKRMIGTGRMSAATRERKALDIVNMGIGFTSTGCFRNCKFCVVPEKEGQLRQATPISEIINPRSNIITLCDNNFTGDPYCCDKMREIIARGLIVDISQGIDLRCIDDEKIDLLSKMRHLRSLHYAWDNVSTEKIIVPSIRQLSEKIKPYRQMCFVLVGFDSTHEEDMHRVVRLRELGVEPYIMKYNSRSDDAYLNHFARWVNFRLYKTVPFAKYEPWINHVKKQGDCSRLKDTPKYTCSSLFEDVV